MRPDLTISPSPSSGLNIGLYIFNVNEVTVLFTAPLKELKITLNKIAAKIPLSDAGNKSTIKSTISRVYSGSIIYSEAIQMKRQSLPELLYKTLQSV